VTQKIYTAHGDNHTTNDSFKRIGAQLRTARKERGMRLADVARELRISNDYLKLLEAGDFDKLPAPTYVSGFLRSYGRFVGLDGAGLASRYYALAGDASSKTQYKLPMTARPPQRSAPAIASICVVLAVMAYGGWYWMNGARNPEPSAGVDLAAVEPMDKRSETMERNAVYNAFETGETATASGDNSNDTGASINLSATKAPLDMAKAPSTPVNDDAGASSVTTVAKMDLQTDAAPAAVTPGPDVLEPVTPEPVTSAPAATDIVVAETDAAITSNSAAMTELAAAVEVEPLQQVTPGRTSAVAGLRAPDQEITIRAIASSWVEIVRADGSAVLTKLMKAGDTYIVDDGSSLYLSTGNAGGIELVTADNDVIAIGAVGEIVRDLPLVKSLLKDRF